MAQIAEQTFRIASDNMAASNLPDIPATCSVPSANGTGPESGRPVPDALQAWHVDAGRLRLDRIVPRLHPAVALLNLCAGTMYPWSAAGTLRRRGETLDVAGLMSEAQRRTGLSDWGPQDDFLKPLAMLASPRQDRAALTFLGRMALKHLLLERLAARLCVQRFVQDNPGVQAAAVARPIIVVGLPRTGTSLLQQLLSQDPCCRPMLGWYTHDLRPPPATSPAADKSRCKDLRRRLWLIYQAVPDLRSIHDATAGGADECLPLLMNSFMTAALGLLADEDEYCTWLRGQAMQRAYEYYRLQLQILQWRLPRGHWVLKSPAHLPHLDVLAGTFPDAAIVQLHRDPLKVVPSMLSMRYKTLAAFNRLAPACLPGMIAESLENMHWMISKAMRDREQAGAGRFTDVSYADLIRDPLAVVRGVYDRFGYAWSRQYEERLRAWIARAARRRRPLHKYALDQFGLDAPQLEERFGAYCSRFAIAKES